MKHATIHFVFFIALITTYSTHGMHQLGKIEKQIVLRKIRCIGKENILRIIEIDNIHKITTLVDPCSKDPFSRLVMQAINEKKQTSSSLGNYTIYRYQKDDFNNPYIELTSIFDKNSLLKAINKE